MLSYKLAQELRDAGFPQEGNGAWIGPPDSLVWRSRDRGYAPTLSELIQACGNNWFSISKVLHESKPVEGQFVAFSTQGQVGRGSSLKEAAARLWLALNTPIVKS